MFGRKKESPAPKAQKQKTSLRDDMDKLALEARPGRDLGTLVVMVRNLTALVLILGIGFIFNGFVSFTALKNSKSRIVVGIDQGGVPTILEHARREVDPLVLMREFLYLYYAYGPDTIKEQFDKMQAIVTPHFWEQFAEDKPEGVDQTIRKNFEDTAIAAGTIQSIQIEDIAIADKTKTGFLVTCRIKISAMHKKVQSDLGDRVLNLQIKVLSGNMTKSNAWGLYIDSMLEM